MLTRFERFTRTILKYFCFHFRSFSSHTVCNNFIAVYFLRTLSLSLSLSISLLISPLELCLFLCVYFFSRSLSLALDPAHWILISLKPRRFSHRTHRAQAFHPPHHYIRAPWIAHYRTISNRHRMASALAVALAALAAAARWARIAMAPLEWEQGSSLHHHLQQLQPHYNTTIIHIELTLALALVVVLATLAPPSTWSARPPAYWAAAWLLVAVPVARHHHRHRRVMMLWCMAQGMVFIDFFFFSFSFSFYLAFCPLN